MTKTLEQLADEYAEDRMQTLQQTLYDPKEIFCAISDAYEQGWKDCDTKKGGGNA